MAPENTVQIQPGRFRKGQSGNSRGRPKGARNSATLACEALLDGEAEALTRKAIELALDGDTVALKLCLERIYPPRKDRPVTFPLSAINTARNAADVMSSVTSAVAAGHVTPADAVEISKVVACPVKAFEAADFADSVQRVQELSDAELIRIAMGGHAAENAAPRLLTITTR